MHTDECCPTGCCSVVCDLRATLTGFNEVTSDGKPDQGDRNGTGYAGVVIDAGAGQICWDVTVANLGNVNLAHIHEGAATTTGPIKVDFGGDLTNKCVSVPSEQINAIIANPSGFYANVHTDEFSAGAIRGQLGSASV